MTRKFVGVTVDHDKVDDLCLAVGLVEGVEIVHVTDARNKKGTLRPRGGVHSPQSAHDPRAVWMYNDRGAIVLDTKATLKKLGLTVGQVMRMTTKLGTLENSVKRSLRTKRAFERARRNNETAIHFRKEAA